ncbi:histidine acid phosphatase [Cryptosporidium muris RN66]|uniref:Inositol hexakisphosphate and diphosphoinositol-pentakisphosphate kinase n=1 Tax=Cryptosporidium muris (strain RN66) TaxID=441375 RepID=B6AFH4_CRYMR|nr:histidine acid phosphatase [Cryptosporidium muris RN66]EEA06965.1 histidine acid phosphatase family protein [Cryptosporidium muris RN66]|eukprot:XP_002141314.1 histidine acid phosphatase [Cryptosporidium muris RN66]
MNVLPEVKYLGNGPFSLGICAMANKVSGIPMQNILKLLSQTGDFTIIIFQESMILEVDCIFWPRVDCLIAFHSNGFPLQKVINYVKLFKPVVMNDIKKQKEMRSRVEIYKVLDKWRIPRPESTVIDHKEVERLKEYDESIFVESQDYIIYRGIRINKPFIEKPIEADRHDNWIYYPQNSGGGCKKLFRKIGDRSSEYDSTLWQVRKNGTFIYEKFIPTFGTDIKVYTVGPMFAHAEARKSPCLDGKVQRTLEGKEVRYAVLLSHEEKIIAHQIVRAFKQTVCGFDILRTTNNRSVVCDVNGWSFVKGNTKYYNDCAHITRIIFLKRLQKKYNFVLRPSKVALDNHDFPKVSTVSQLNRENINKYKDRQIKEMSNEELSTVIVVMRHGDRKPKLKLKFESSHPLILAFQINNSSTKRLKSPEELSLLLSRNSTILEYFFMKLEDPMDNIDFNECRSIMKTIHSHSRLRLFLEQGEGFSGVNRKVQLKPIEWKNNVKLKHVTKVLVIAKWGGDLTNVGREQAEQMGRRLRATLYPGDSEGLLRLHSTFRHDFKIYSSDEGRCQLTSAAFTKGFLDLEGDLTPILVQLVIRDSYAHHLLDDPTSMPDRKICKDMIEYLLNVDQVITDKVIDKLWEEKVGKCCIYKELTFGKHSQNLQTLSKSVKEALIGCGNPLDRLKTLYQIMCSLVTHMKDIQIHNHEDSKFSRVSSKVSGGSLLKNQNKYISPWSDIKYRWKQLTISFYNQETNRYATNKIPDIFDNVTYDLNNLHSYVDSNIKQLLIKIHDIVRPLKKFVSKSQYGLTSLQKVAIGKGIVYDLLDKLRHDIKYSYLRNLANINTIKKSPMYCTVYTGSQIDSYDNTINLSSVQNYSTEKLTQVHDEEHIRLKEEEASAFGIKSPWRIVRSRFYVTSASHIQSLVNIILATENKVNEKLYMADNTKTLCSLDLNYLSHIVFRVWECRSTPKLDHCRYRLEIYISNGIKSELQVGSMTINENISLDSSNEYSTQSLSLNGPINQLIKHEIGPLVKISSNNLHIRDFEQLIENVLQLDSS